MTDSVSLKVATDKLYLLIIQDKPYLSIHIYLNIHMLFKMF